MTENPTSTASENPSPADLCPQCGKAVPSGAPHGLCPRCLIAGADTVEDTGAAKLPSLDDVRIAFPQLEILELIGHGGMGAVFKARQPRLDRFVALKLLPKHLAADPAFAERFAREGRLLAKLVHPNIVTVHDVGEEGGFLFLIMEFVDGVNLRQAIRSGSVTVEQALAIVPSICEALQYAHDEGVLHRDIKPENILLDSRGRVKIADFGIAKLMGEGEPAGLTLSGASPGTPHYMAPEQIERPGNVDHRADIYSLGVVFYELLTGELPLGRFPAPSEKAGTVDARVDQVVFKSLEKERDRRQQSATEFQTQVEELDASSSTVSPSPAPTASEATSRVPAKKKSRTPQILAIAAYVALLLLGIPALAGVSWLEIKAVASKAAVSELEHAERSSILAEIEAQRNMLLEESDNVRLRITTARTDREKSVESQRLSEIEQQLVALEKRASELQTSPLDPELPTIAAMGSKRFVWITGITIMVALFPACVLGWIALALGRKQQTSARQVSASFGAAMLLPILAFSMIIYSLAVVLNSLLPVTATYGVTAGMLMSFTIGFVAFLLADLCLLRICWKWANSGSPQRIHFFTPKRRHRLTAFGFLFLGALLSAAAVTWTSEMKFLFPVLAMGFVCVGSSLLTEFIPGRRSISLVVSFLLCSAILAAILTTSHETITHQRVKVIQNRH